MKNILKNAGFLMWTGLMSVAGAIGGLIIFKPECVTFGKDTKKEKEES